MSVIAELAEERIVEGVYAVARKQRLRTKGGAPYLALELVDPSGRIDARVWHDVELKLVAVALDPAEHAHGVAFCEARVEQVDVLPDPALDPSARVDELEREIVRPAARA